MTRQRYILIVILFFHSVNTYMDRACISAAKTPIIQDLGLTDQIMGYVFGIFAIGYALFQVPGGWIADRFGPRRALTLVVSFWSLCTMLTGTAFNGASLLIYRFLFGAGEAGAFPGAARAFYRWLPVRERGMGQGINFSGARLGAALSLLVMPWLVQAVGWRLMFVVNGVMGLLWVLVWRWWFTNEPKDHPAVDAAEARYIEDGLQDDFTAGARIPFSRIVTSLNMALTMFQYLASNVTFFISFTWLLPYLVDRWGPGAEVYAPIPLVMGAAANWVAGGMVTRLYARGHHVNSRRLPAVVGFGLAVITLILATRMDSAAGFILCFSLATFGVDMTLSPSWSFCMDIGGRHTGTVSAAMNMMGNIGSALSAVLFPFFVAHVTVPGLVPATGTANSFFLFAATLNVLAIAAWAIMNPARQTEITTPVPHARLKVALFFGVIVLTAVAFVAYNLFSAN